MIDNRVKQSFLQQLEETGNVFRTCRRVGIPHTSTIYRWAEKSPTFKKKMEEAQRIGRLNAVDVAEGSMVNNAAEGDYKSQVFLLRHLSPLYKPPARQVNIEHKRAKDEEEEFQRLQREHWNAITDAYKHLGEMVRSQRLTNEETEKILGTLPDVNITGNESEPDGSADR